MADTGSKFPTSGTSTAEAPYDDRDVSNPGNICASDLTSATVAEIDETQYSYILRAQGFDFSAIPSGATIDGVVCTIKSYCHGDVDYTMLKLLDTGGSLAGTNKCAVPVALSVGAFSEDGFGGAADTWGNALTRAWVQDADFGVGVGFLSNLNESDLGVDYISLVVYYTEHPSGGGAKCVAHSFSRPTIISGG